MQLAQFKLTRVSQTEAYYMGFAVCLWRFDWLREAKLRLRPLHCQINKNINIFENTYSLTILLIAVSPVEKGRLPTI